jgi:hypothetical protein
MIAMLNVHHSGFGELERPDYWRRHAIMHRGRKRIGEILTMFSILQYGGHRNARTK